jgi:excinuclease ABC subunit A
MPTASLQLTFVRKSGTLLAQELALVPKSTIDSLEYYAQHSIMTDPREHGGLLADLPDDVWGTCTECGGTRFNRQTLEVTYKGKSVADVLDMDVQEALEFFANHPKVVRILQTLCDVGLDYIKLGQSALTLSGGEAQRVKLAKELSRRDTGRTFYILDEPTTGPHFADIQKLLDVLHRLTDAGNTVVIIEHNLDVIRTADWIIDLGPEGGEEGGYVVVEGNPGAVAQVTESYTGQFLRRVLQSYQAVSRDQA